MKLACVAAVLAVPLWLFGVVVLVLSLVDLF